MANFKGKFIVIDGTDGSGKATQTELIVERLRNAGYPVEVADFPQYGQKSANLVEKYLNGKYGTAEEVGPYRASIFYAVDRYDASFKMRKWLNEGKIVISNRYVTANMGHQGGKINDPVERKKYFDWLYDLEYQTFGIPRPDLNIILHVDAAIAQKLVENKGERTYITDGNKDIHEKDLEHLRNAEKVYLEITRTFPNFELIECVKNGQIMPKEEINEMIWRKIIKLFSQGTPTPIQDEDYKIYSSKEFFNTALKTGSTINYSPNFKIPPKDKKNKIEIAPVGQNDFILKVEKVSSHAKLPTKAHMTDAGFDLYSADFYSLLHGEITNIRTGIKLAIPEGYVGLIWDKSGIAKNGMHTLAGVIDSGYRGEIMITIINLSNDIAHVAHGQKIAQILIQKVESPDLKEIKIDNETPRGQGGYGSSGLF